MDGGVECFLVCEIIHYNGSVCVYDSTKYGIVCVSKCIAHLLFLSAEVTYVKPFYCAQYTLFKTYPI
jgi:hypothetical protein